MASSAAEVLKNKQKDEEERSRYHRIIEEQGYFRFYDRLSIDPPEVEVTKVGDYKIYGCIELGFRIHFMSLVGVGTEALEIETKPGIKGFYLSEVTSEGLKRILGPTQTIPELMEQYFRNTLTKACSNDPLDFCTQFGFAFKGGDRYIFKDANGVCFDLILEMTQDSNHQTFYSFKPGLLGKQELLEGIVPEKDFEVLKQRILTKSAANKQQKTQNPMPQSAVSISASAATSFASAAAGFSSQASLTVDIDPKIAKDKPTQALQFSGGASAANASKPAVIPKQKDDPANQAGSHASSASNK